MKLGICRLCGKYKELSFEHIPPQSAFNDKMVVFETMHKWMQGYKNPIQKFPRGMGKYSLCEQCNKSTGLWYGTEFAHWAEQGLNWFEKTNGQSSLYLPFYIRPLNVIKQILVMMVAMASEATLEYHNELRRFLLNREQKYLPPWYSVYVYFKTNSQPRFEAEQAISNDGSVSYIDAEIALPPFGYCVSSSRKGNNILATSKQLYNIGWFSRFDYNIWTQVQLRLPVLETNSPLPLDYRTKDEVTDSPERN